ncbi:type VI secretion system-associated protein VasI [Buttiauxella agrestis]|uniref:type VI secretion system-associated protein VasI n=1 Tax=Buttiauxella agrestis TaxID=82977 RepID=UPI00155F79A5|nr:type VI secretion system-associated protein VasI [Buttiauxella agrestis]BCG10648.1 type VI secretion system-associated protein TagO [Buttiauxella agrestis]
MKGSTLASILLALIPLQASCASTQFDNFPTEATLKAMLTCRAEPASLVRLDCYDHALAPQYPGFAGALKKAQLQGDAWMRAYNQELQRDDHSTTFITRQTEGERPSVVITTPALGSVPPRPVLMFSCIDNITRMQIALPEPLKSAPNLSITTEKTHLNVHWFLRESDSLLESSRGLAGIDEIKQLFAAQTLTVDIAGQSQPSLHAMTFAITDLEKTLEPMRAACHWAS